MQIFSQIDFSQIHARYFITLQNAIVKNILLHYYFGMNIYPAVGWIAFWYLLTKWKIYPHLAQISPD